MKLSFDETLERLANEQRVSPSEVSARALRRKVWISGNGLPGCMYDNGPHYHATKRDAIESCAFAADWCDDSPNPYRGIVQSLRRYHSFTAATGERFEISQDTLGGII